MPKPGGGKRRRGRRVALATVAAAAAVPHLFVRSPPMPPGTAETGPWRGIVPGDVRLLVDDTAWDPAAGERIHRHEIFDGILRMIDASASVVVADFFLWNTWGGTSPEAHRPLALPLAEALAARAGAPPEAVVLAMTDPLNRRYGGLEPPWAARLRGAGVPLVFTDLARLPDSNPIWSRPARFYGAILDRPGPVRRWADRPRLPDPFEGNAGPRLSVRQISRLLHFKANHRKVLVTDTADGGLRVLVGGFNPADGSAAHGNTALRVGGDVARDALHSELAVMRWSLDDPDAAAPADAAAMRQALDALAARFPAAPVKTSPAPGSPRARWLTESGVAEAIAARLDALGPGDRADLALFYLGDRGVIRRLRAAAARGARFRIILDANRDAFGRRKNGVPNRPVAAELMRAARRGGWDLAVRWADTHGEQFHHKAMATTQADGMETLLLGSTNWTRRNLRDRNLEANLEVEQAPEAMAAWRRWFDAAWANADGLVRTRPYEAFAEGRLATALKTVQYRLQSATGAGTF